MCTDAHICISYSDSYTPKGYFVQCLYQLCQHDRRCNIISTAITTGKAIATSIPALRLSAAALDTNPTSVGPPEHPRSPANANSANIAVPPSSPRILCFYKDPALSYRFRPLRSAARSVPLQKQMH